MDKSAKSKTGGIIGGGILLVVTLVGFMWIWNTAQPAAVTNTAIDQKYQTVDISGLVSTAQSLVADKQNAGGLPLKTPATDQIGRDNPFATN